MSAGADQPLKPLPTPVWLGSNRMMIKEAPKKVGTKELKVNIPVRYHLQLHSLKVLEGRQIHGVVEEALDMYFARLNRPKTDVTL